jgi:hypothetical protein
MHKIQNKYFEYLGIKYKLLLLSNSGSRLFGTSFEKGEYKVNPDYESDYDYKGIIISYIDDKLKYEKPLSEIQFNEIEKDEIDRKNFISLINQTYKLNLKIDADLTLFEIEKFFELLDNNNPNSLDILFASKTNMLYFDESINEIYKNKKMFLTKKVFKSFYEYGKSQIYKINSAKKWINKYPKTDNVLNMLIQLYKDRILNEEWIKNYFNFNVLERIKLNNEGLSNTFEVRMKWESFENFVEYNNLLKNFDITLDELNKYRSPFLSDYINVSNLNNDTYQVKRNMNLFSEKYKDITIKEFLKTKATLRKKSESLYFIYDSPNDNEWGVFTKYNDIKNNDHSSIGEFMFLLSVDRSNYIKDKKINDDLWKWKTERNEKRNKLETLFGYDVKHASHLYRLMKKSQIILKTNNYFPELNKEEVIFIKKILEGHFSYEEILKEVEVLQKEIENTKNQLPEEINMKIFNKLLLNINKYDLNHNIKNTEENILNLE